MADQEDHVTLHLAMAERYLAEAEAAAPEPRAGDPRERLQGIRHRQATQWPGFDPVARVGPPGGMPPPPQGLQGWQP